MRPDGGRRAWLEERRAAVRAQYDAEAPEYDDHPYPSTSHEAFVRQLLDTCPPGGTVLDAPCGTGRYFDQVRAAGRPPRTPSANSQNSRRDTMWMVIRIRLAWMTLRSSSASVRAARGKSRSRVQSPT